MINAGETLSIRLPKEVDKSVVCWLNKQTSVSASLIRLIEMDIENNGKVRDLSKKDYNIPMSGDMWQPIFNCISESKEEVPISYIYNYCQKAFNISVEDRAIPLKNGIESLFEKRVRYALLQLTYNGFITTTRRGFYVLDIMGRSAKNTKMQLDEFIIKLEQIQDKRKREGTLL